MAEKPGRWAAGRLGLILGHGKCDGGRQRSSRKPGQVWESSGTEQRLGQGEPGKQSGGRLLAGRKGRLALPWASGPGGRATPWVAFLQDPQPL